MFSLKCFFDDMWWMHGWCLYWRFVPCGNCVQNQVHTHTHTLHHQPLRTIQYWFNHNQYQFNSIYHKSSFKKLSPIISNPKESFQVSMTPKDCMKLSLPTAGIRVPIAIQAIPTSYTPWILCVAMAKFMYFCYHPYIYIYINVPAKVSRKLAMKLLKCTINPTW